MTDSTTTDRSTIATVTFLHPTHLEGAGDLPAGTYSVETMEEQIPGLSFLAYRRVHTTIVAERLYGASVVRQVMAIDPADLESALERDRHPSFSQTSA